MLARRAGRGRSSRTTSPSSQVGQLGGLGVEGPARGAPARPRRARPRRCRRRAGTRRRRSGRPTRRSGRRCRCGRRPCRRAAPRWKPRSFQPIVVGSSAGSSAAHGPGSAHRVEVVGQHPAGGAAVERDLDRLDVGQGPAHGAPWSRPATRPGRPRCRGRRRAARPPPARRTPRRSWQRPAPRPASSRSPSSGAARSSSRRRSRRGTIAPDAASGDDHPRGDRDVGLVVPLAAGDPRVERRQAGAHLGGGERARRPRSAARTSARCSSAQAAPSVAMPGGLDLLGQPADLLAGDPGAGAPPDGREQVAREGEDGAPHRELLDHRAVVVERAVDVARWRRQRAHARGGPRPARWRADTSPPRRRPGCRPPVGQGVAHAEPGPALVVVDVPRHLAHVTILPEATPGRRSRGCDRARPGCDDPAVPAARRTVLVLVGLVLLSFNLRPAAVSVGPVLDEVRDGLGLSGPEAGLLTSLPVLAFAVFGALAPTVARRSGLHRGAPRSRWSPWWSASAAAPRSHDDVGVPRCCRCWPWPAWRRPTC